MAGFIIGLSGANHVEVEVLSATGDWFEVKVSAKADDIWERFDGRFARKDFILLRDELTRLHRDLSGTMLFDSATGQLRLEISGDGKGRFLIHWDDELLFSIDQSYIPAITRDLDEIIALNL